MENRVATAAMMRKKSPNKNPVFENAYGSDSAPAPKVAEQRLKILPRTEPSRKNSLNEIRESLFLKSLENGVLPSGLQTKMSDEIRIKESFVSNTFLQAFQGRQFRPLKVV